MTDQLRSHTVSPQNLAQTVAAARERIIAAGDQQHVTVERQLEILEQLISFEFGRFLLQNRGVNGYWTDYFLMHPRGGRVDGKNSEGNVFTELESFMLNRSPVLLATQQRFEIFLQQNQQVVKEGAVLASIPCGLLGELLNLDYSGIKNVELVGVDLDQESLDLAQASAEEKGLSQFVTLERKDAWELNISERFDLISSNGLSIYEPDDQKLLELYQQFFQALKVGGKLVTSFLTHTPVSGGVCEWQMDKVNKEDALLQRIIFADVVATGWQCYRSTEETRGLLQQAGFKDIEFIYDTAHIFPTVVCYR